MKTKILFFAGIFISQLHFSQQLKNILEGYTISKIPTNHSIVGAKWVTNLGATTDGLPENQLIISQSLNNLALDTENTGSLSLGLLSSLGLGGYSSNDLKVVFNKLEVYTVKDLYKLPLVEGEKMVFSSLNAAAFDLIFNDNISASIMAKLPKNTLEIEGEVDYGNKKRISVNGTNLFVAHKIVTIDKIKTKTKTKSFREAFEIKDLAGYDFVFNSNELVRKSIIEAVSTEGLEQLSNFKYLDNFIVKYSKRFPIKVNITNTSKGNLGVGMFNEIKEICYCELNNGDKHIYPITVVNVGDQVTYDYFQVDHFWITYSMFPGVTKDNMPVGIVSTDKNSKLSLISKTYYISKALE
ncbi:hypothetical protein [Chryseobacterium geocarposphaerae]|uniref:Uncharacterized protein n=1 Tax=Chryseobacterium geocarposphaerae TaxID=1416776 RepID=A0A2M9C944_9FLAO|nr:hypothetical protein [Chryseobacterium geocarposphaerae]PJJ67336.1 hypothetical protein CLV73_1342 [Chryseobacterium geocarposphaerae]